MRLLIYGMQSSGASLFALFCAQNPRSIAMIDCWGMAPGLEDRGDVVAKVTISTDFPLQRHVDRFRPDRKLLFLRDPYDVYVSLARKPYRDLTGRMEDKLRLMDEAFQAGLNSFDRIITFEEFVLAPDRVARALGELGWTLPADAQHLPRDLRDIEEAIVQRTPDLYLRCAFSDGNMHRVSGSVSAPPEARKPHIEAVVDELCPRTTAYYRERRPALLALGRSDGLDVTRIAGAMIDLALPFPFGAGGADGTEITFVSGYGKVRLVNANPYVAAYPQAFQLHANPTSSPPLRYEFTTTGSVPFNRFRAAVETDATSFGVRLAVQVTDAEGKPLAGREYVFEPGGVLTVDLELPEHEGPITLSLSPLPAAGRESHERTVLLIHRARLVYIPNWECVPGTGRRAI